MQITIIACEVFYREISYYASQSPNPTQVRWLPQGLHNTPDLLRQKLREEIAEIERKIAEKEYRNEPEVILLGYGLCSNGTTGLTAGSIPIVIPRTDDCIGVFLGSQKRYLQLFNENPGTYWLNHGWVETAFIPSRENYAKLRVDYAALYGEDNADFLLECENTWIKEYTCCGYIRSTVNHDTPYLRQAKETTDYCGWKLLEFDGAATYLQAMLNAESLADYQEEAFLICPPGSRVEPSFDERKIIAVPSV